MLIEAVVYTAGVVNVRRDEVADTTVASLPHTVTTFNEVSSVLKFDPLIVKVVPPANEDTIPVEEVNVGNSIRI